MPALTFGAAISDRVTIASCPAFADGTVGLLLNCTSSTAFQVVYRAGPDIGVFLDFAGSGQIQMFRERATTYVSSDAAASNYAYWGVNKWVFLFHTWNTTGTNADQRGLIGDLWHAPMEPSSYALQTVGSGAANTTSGAFNIGQKPSNDSAFRGRIAWVGVWNKGLGPGEIRKYWDALRRARTRRQIAGLYVDLDLGYPAGTGTQYDRSGNVLHGTVTGATFARSSELDPLLRPLYTWTFDQVKLPALRPAKPWLAGLRPAAFRPGLAR